MRTRPAVADTFALVCYVAGTFLEGADANPVDYKSLIEVAKASAPVAHGPLNSEVEGMMQANRGARAVRSVHSRTYALLVTSSIWSGAKLVRCEAASLSELVAKVAGSCSLPRPGANVLDEAPGNAATDTPGPPRPVHLLLNETILTEDAFAAMPERARIKVEYSDSHNP